MNDTTKIIQKCLTSHKSTVSVFFFLSWIHKFSQLQGANFVWNRKLTLNKLSRPSACSVCFFRSFWKLKNWLYNTQINNHNRSRLYCCLLAVEQNIFESVIHARQKTWKKFNWQKCLCVSTSSRPRWRERDNENIKYKWRTTIACSRGAEALYFPFFDMAESINYEPRTVININKML